MSTLMLHVLRRLLILVWLIVIECAEVLQCRLRDVHQNITKRLDAPCPKNAWDKCLV